MNIFLSYSYADSEQINKVKEYLYINNIGTIVEYDLNIVGNNLFDELRYNIRKSDYVIIFLSNNFLNSKFSLLELSEAINELKMRKITIIPLIIGKCSVPNDILEFGVIDFTKSFEKGITRLLDRLDIHQKIKLENIDLSTYEKVVGIFLEEYGFDIIQTNINNDIDVDFVCEYYSTDPFGNKTKEIWLVESKYYKHERFSINNIHELYNYMKNVYPKKSKLLMITNSILNSATVEYLEKIKKDTLTDIIVIDCPTFERLIFKRKRLSKRVNEVLYASNK
jgi:hypothetical protein